MSATRLSGLVAIVLLCGIVTAGAATRAPGSIEPAAAAPSSQETAKPAESAQAAKPRARPTRRCGYRRFYLLPPPQYWFKPRYRCYRSRS